jgi:endoglucanase
VTASNTIDNYNIFAVILNGKQVARKSVNGLNFSTDTKLTKTFNWAIPATVVLGTHKMINPWSWSSAGGNRGIAAQCTTSIQCGMPLVGVNIDGGELNSSDAVDTLHTDYIYPSKAEIDYFASKGLKIIRVPFELSRLELSPGAPLDTTTLGYLKQIVSWAAADGVTVLLDPHDYGYAWGHLIGTDSGDTTNVQFGNFWSEVAAAFKSYPNVAFGIMNEPHVQTAEEWAVSDNAAIAAIRQTGATQEIMVPGVDYTNAGNWIVSRSAAAINPSTIVDPGHNYAFEVHEYLDPNSSGTTFAPITDPDLGVERLRAVTQWAYSTGAKLFLGEFGVPPDSYSLGALLNTLTYMRRNANVWQGIAYFSGGPWWPAGYPFSVEPTGLGTSTVSDAPQMGVLDQFSSPCTLSSPQ